jgi:hypothetical protein
MSNAIYRAAALAVALAAAASAVWGQETVRVRGVIAQQDGDIYVVTTRTGGDVRLKLAPGAGIAASVKASLADIKAGTYIGVAALPQSDGTQRALEVHIFHESMRGTGEGHRPWDLQPQSTMTNATVEHIVAGTDGHSVTVRYKDGEKRIAVPPGTVIVAYLPGAADELKAGAAVFVPAASKRPDGTLEAQRVMVGRDAAPPQ